MLLTALLCVALLVALGAIAGPLLVLDHVLERHRAVLEAEALGHLTDPVAAPPAPLPAPRPALPLEGAPGPEIGTDSGRRPFLEPAPAREDADA